MSLVHPEIGSRGTIEVAQPYEAIFSPRVIYECISVESLAGLLNAGLFPYDLFYQPFGISIEIYKEDIEINSPIIGFKTSDGRVFKIPSRFIKTLPQADGVVYQSLSLGVALSIVEEGADIDPLVEEIKQLIMDRIGVSCAIQAVVTGPNILLDHNQHRAVRLSRKDSAVNKPTYLLQYREIKTKHDSLKAYADRLEKTLEKQNGEIIALKEGLKTKV